MVWDRTHHEVLDPETLPWEPVGDHGLLLRVLSRDESDGALTAQLRNYMPHLFRTDLVRLLRETGFDNPEIIPFDERGGGLRTDGSWPQRAEWHFPWLSFERYARPDL